MNLELDEPLESLGDPWPELRRVAELAGDGEMVTVRFGRDSGFRLKPFDVDVLLRLTGFEPQATAKTAAGYQTRARRRTRVTQDLSCTVVVPCRNEVDNVEPLFRRLPALGKHTELIFVDGGSTDGTPERIERLTGNHPNSDIKLLRQREKTGKAGAVFQGFDAATGQVLIILDADMTVAPEDLPRFYLALTENVADFVNGTRLIYPMEEGAMPDLNVIGNRAFGLLLSWLMGQRITDTLCGTKALFKRDWPRIAAARQLFGGHDPWGDFDLLLGAAYAGLRIVDVPVRYHARTAGESKMRVLSHGLALTQTCLMGMRRLKLEGSSMRSR